MKMERINAWMSFAGNIAVLLGLVALAVEINGNTKALRVQVTENTYAMQQERVAAVAGDTDLQALYVKSLLNPSELTPSEVWGLVSYLDVRLASIHRAYLLYEDGVISEASWEDTLSLAPYMFSGAFGHLYWSETKEGWAEFPDFVAAVDAELAESEGKGLSNEEWLRGFLEKVADLDS